MKLKRQSILAKFQWPIRLSCVHKDLDDYGILALGIFDKLSLAEPYRFNDRTYLNHNIDVRQDW